MTFLLIYGVLVLFSITTKTHNLHHQVHTNNLSFGNNTISKNLLVHQFYSQFTHSPLLLLQKKISFSQSIVTHGTRLKKEVALTFDADMTPWMKEQKDLGYVTSYYDSRVITELEKTNTSATFFLTGMWIQMYPTETKAFGKNKLFELANHSYSHPSFAGSCFGLSVETSNQLPDEINKTQELLKNVGNTSNSYFRFPGGCYDNASLAVVQKEHLTVVHWDTVGNDGFNPDTSSIVSNVLSQTTNGSIIALHLGGESNTPHTADALPAIIENLKQRGFIFVTVSQLLSDKQITIAPTPLLTTFFTNQGDPKTHLLSVNQQTEKE